MYKMIVKDRKSKRSTYLYFDNLKDINAFYKSLHKDFPDNASKTILVDIGHIFKHCECTVCRG